ncbi:helix-turn-helix domain-containing protein [Nocardia sp. NEAU-G5]|uniref:Helix-turn-helix domain-containing protein n=1 Tax=Nocardia albiluteola TaxID=2842303 RepID=A0ABS6B4C4_9NOCA|nr:helix-turn-helix transcriptional regulator [Nocardia albiluteola]MBU3064093.1 helix-turn-helix domain-containing protein [Nocardia albiluteola]
MADDEERDLYRADEIREHAEALQQIRDQEIEEYRRQLEAEHEPELQRHRESMREAFEWYERAFGDRTRQWRKARNWSQEDLANRLTDHGFEMHQTTVAKIERGTRPLRVAEAVAIAQIFGVPPLTVFYGAGPEDEPMSASSMRELMESYEESITRAEEQLEDAAKQVAYWARQRAVATDALNRAALEADRTREP